MLVNLDHSRARLEHLRNDPRVSLTVLDDDDWYRHVSLRGPRRRDRARRGPEGHRPALRTTTATRPTANRDSPRFSAWIEIHTWHAWNVVS